MGPKAGEPNLDGTVQTLRIEELMALNGQTALITGGTGHIGSKICEGLAQLGATILVVDRDSTRCRQLATELPNNSRSYPTDLQSMSDIERLIGDVQNDFDGLDILVNCAAFVGTSKMAGWAAPFSDQSFEAWSAALHLNLSVPFVLSQKLAPSLRRRHGRILNIASIYGKFGPDLSLYEGTEMHNPAAYGASKGGLIQLTRYLATVLAPDIRVNALSPGGIERNQPESFIERYNARTPLRRMGREEDLLGAAVFLVSNMSSYVTGQNLFVDGGWSAW